MPVVTTTVLAVGAREMAKEKAIVNRSGFQQVADVKVCTLNQCHNYEEADIVYPLQAVSLGGAVRG